MQQRRIKCHERMTKVAERRQKFGEIIKKPKKKKSWQEVSRRIVDVLGDLPPVIPYTGPLNPNVNNSSPGQSGSTPSEHRDNPSTTPPPPEP